MGGSYLAGNEYGITLDHILKAFEENPVDCSTCTKGKIKRWLVDLDKDGKYAFKSTFRVAYKKATGEEWPKRKNNPDKTKRHNPDAESIIEL